MTPQDEQFLQAALNGDETLVKMYLSQEYQITHLYEWPISLKQQAFVYSPNTTICSFLLAAGAEANKGIDCEDAEEKSRTKIHTTALCEAVKQGNLKKVQFLLLQHVDVNKPYKYEFIGPGTRISYQKTPLLLAQENGPTEIAELLKSAGAKEK